MRFSGTSSLCSSLACSLTALLAVFLPATALAVTHPEVLVVYNTNSSDSLAVANHYMSQRNIPAANLCAITPPATDIVSLANYTTYIKTPIQNCLNALGQKNILYIVMTYMTPYDITTGPFGLSAVDSYLADIWDKYVSQPFLGVPNLTQPYYADSQSQGNVYSPFQTFAAYRANARNPLIYSVWRLDGPSAAIASALVDQALTSEGQGGPVGQACFDETFDGTIFSDQGTSTANWDLYKASQFLSAAGRTVLLDTLQSEFGTPPSPNCPNTAFYTGWYSLDHYNDAFTWNTGAVGWHLDSGSATNPRSGSDWAPNALLRGITVTTGSVTEPYLQGLVRPGGTFRNLMEGASVGDAFLRNTRWLKWQIMYIGDPLYKPFGSGVAPFSPLQPVNSFMISPQEIVGGTNSTGTITISAAAPPGGTTFNLSAQSGATVPATATVAAGATKVSFPITTAVVGTSLSPILTATAGPLTLQNTIITDPLLGGFAASATTTMAGYPITVQVLLNARAPVGGATIALSSDNTVIGVPNSVTVPAGSTAATFTATSTTVSTATPAHIMGSYAGATSSLTISVVPGLASMGAGPSTINPGGITVISVDLPISVPPGFTANVQMQSSDPVALPVPAVLTFTNATGIYNNFIATSSASAPGEIVTITATFGGSTLTTQVTINPPLSLNGPGTCRQGQVCNFAASFGTPPYTYSLVTGSVGSINSSSGAYTAPSHITPQQAINGCQAFPNNSIFNTRIDNLPVHPNNALWMSNITPGANVFQAGQRISGSTVLSTGTVLPINSAAPNTDVAAFSFDCNGTQVLGQTDLFTFTGATYVGRPMSCSQTVSDGVLHMVMRIQGVAYGPHNLCSANCYVPSYQGAANIVTGLVVGPS
jgi:uncharacterized protein (TIGR03790 family)